MSIKDTLFDEQVKRDQNTDLSYEHETHNSFIENCYECSVEKEENEYDCNICHDTGVIEIMGGSDADEWGVVDEKVCECQLSDDE